MIDIREIEYVHINDTKSFAKIGGGILMDKLAAELSKQDTATAIGSVPFVGYAGWAMYGGYGPFSANYGLGVDNIVGAKVVTSDGAVVDADQTMLRGNRGSGGFLGVIVELTIKIYPLKKLIRNDRLEQ